MKKIRGLLKLRGLTPAQLGHVAGLSRSTMSRIMHGHIPSDETLNWIAEALEVSGADGVDVSSGVESAPGEKDPELIEAFLIACGL